MGAPVGIAVEVGAAVGGKVISTGQLAATGSGSTVACQVEQRSDDQKLGEVQSHEIPFALQTP